MPSQWFYRAADSSIDERVGPLTSTQLLTLAQQGKLRPADVVWKDGMPKWVPAGKVPKLLEAMAAAAKQESPAQPQRAVQAPADALPEPGSILSAAPHEPSVPARPNVLPARVIFNGLVPTYPPFAAWSFVLCLVGWIWGIIVWAKLYGSINRLLGEKRLTFLSAWIPIWGMIQMAQASNHMNDIIDQRQLPINKMQHNAFFILLCPPVELHRLINQWNRIAEVVRGQ